MSDPGIQRDCPNCGLEVFYRFSEQGTHYYFCLSHGYITWTPDGVVRVAASDDYVDDDYADELRYGRPH